MALSANTVWEVRTTGNDSNGGGFVTGASGTDRSQQDAAHVTLTAANASVASTTWIDINPGAYTVISGDVGNILQITGGDAIPGVYQIIAVNTSLNRWQLDRSPGSNSDTVEGKMGGAFATPGKLSSLGASAVSGMQAWIKSGTYVITTATPGASGPVLMPSAISFAIEGYATTRGDRGGRPVLDAGAVTSVTLWSGNSNGGQSFIHVAADGNGNSTVTGFSLTNARWNAIDCDATSCTTGFNAGSNVTPNMIASRALSCTTGFSGGIPFSCWAHTCGTGISTAYGAIGCLVTSCTGSGVVLTGNGASAMRCTSHGNSSSGFATTGGPTGVLFLSCCATSNGAYGYNTLSTSILSRCASRSNTSGRLNATPVKDDSSILLTDDPYVDAAGLDFRPNNDADGGTLLRNAGTDVFGQSDNKDVGAVQHMDSGGGSPNLLRTLQSLSGATVNG